MRAISSLSFDEGISTVSWAAMIPLRILVKKSAIGSVIDMAGTFYAGVRVSSTSAYQLDFVMPGM